MSRHSNSRGSGPGKQGSFWDPEKAVNGVGNDVPPKVTSRTRASGGRTLWSNRCRHSPVKLDKGEFHGGNCHVPEGDDCDVYVNLDTIKSGWTAPWASPVIIDFPIKNMGVPASKIEYRRLCGWLAEKIQDGKRVHVGCIGGHGRTGLILCGILKSLGYDDPILYGREHYCSHIVESLEQTRFLSDVLDIPEHGPSKKKHREPPKGGARLSTGIPKEFGWRNFRKPGNLRRLEDAEDGLDSSHDGIEWDDGA